MTSLSSPEHHQVGAQLPKLPSTPLPKQQGSVFKLVIEEASPKRVRNLRNGPSLSDSLVVNASLTLDYTASGLLKPTDYVSHRRGPANQRAFNPPRAPRSNFARARARQAKGGSNANHISPHLGPAPQPLRFPGFAAQQAPQNRNAPLVSGRLQNTKLGNGTSWGFGAAINGASGLPSAQSRQPGAASSNFVGGSQPATPLDLSEFPSLSGAPQPQYSNPSQAIWANANQRAIQHTPVQRPQQQHPVNPQPVSQPQQQQQSHQPQDTSHQNSAELFSPTSRFASGIDDYRHGGQGGVGQLSGSGQPQTGNIEEFPPLGRNGNDDAGHDQRGSLIQNAAFGGFSTASTFILPPNATHTRHGLPNTSSSQADTTRSSTLANRSLSPSNRGFGAAAARSPAESTRVSQNGGSEHEQNLLSMGKLVQHGGHNLNSLLQTFHEPQMAAQQPSAQSQSQVTRPQQGYAAGTSESPGMTHALDLTVFSQMNPVDRFGLAGLLATVRSENTDVANLAIGQDLTQLGLNLNSPDPLYPTFAGPFAESGSRPMQPDFCLPECYTVGNAHKVVDKIPGFSDETLFWIFYTQPRDILQEQAAAELTSRNWRYHKDLMMWVTKDQSLPDPIPISAEAEKGSYVFFNHMTWNRVRSEFVLHYDALDNHIPVRSSIEGRQVPF